MLSAKSSNGNRVKEIERQIEPGKSSAKSNGFFFGLPDILALRRSFLVFMFFNGFPTDSLRIYIRVVHVRIRCTEAAGG